MHVSSPAPRRLALGGLAAMAAALGVGRFVYTPILPPMTAELGLTQGEAGLIASANFVGYLAGALVAASPRLPGTPRTWLLTALLASAVTTGAMGMVSGLPAMLVLRFAGGLASAFVLVFASSLVLERLAQAGRSDLSAIHFAGVGLGIALSAVLVAFLSVSGVDWRGLWWGAGVLSLISVPLVAGLVVRSDGDRPRVAVPPGTRRMSGGLVRLIAAYGLFGFGYVITATFLVAIVRTDPGMRAIEPAVWLLVGLAGVPSVAVWGWIGRRIGVARAFAVAALVEAVGVLSSVAANGAPGAVVAALLLGGTFMGLTALGLVEARSRSTGDPRRTLALMTAAFGVGQIVGPVAAGYAHDLTGGYGWSSLGAALALVVAAALTIGLGGDSARVSALSSDGRSSGDS